MLEGHLKLGSPKVAVLGKEFWNYFCCYLLRYLLEVLPKLPHLYATGFSLLFLLLTTL
jgi:hypothetical protein